MILIHALGAVKAWMTANYLFFAAIWMILGAAVILLLLRIFVGPLFKAQFTPIKPGGTSFDDVGGCGEVVAEVRELADFLKKPKQYEHLGATVPKGCILHGPPGTGKTLLAKALASEAGVPFFSVAGSQFVEKFVGVGAQRVRSLYKHAARHAPCVVYIDEIDSLGRARGGGSDGGSREGDQTLTQLLQLMDGVQDQKRKPRGPILWMSSTNRVDVLDPALLRPGRFDRQIAVDLPDKAGRLEVLRVHAAGKPLSSSVSLERVAQQTTGMSGAELANVLNEAAIEAARREAQQITPNDLHRALLRVAAGAEKESRWTEEEREVVAWHEAGHALAAHLLGVGVTHHISIIPRGRSGGQTFYHEEDDRHIPRRSDLEGSLCRLLGGRAAEELRFGEVSAGASDDLYRASQIVDGMLLRYGMGRSLGLYAIGPEAPSADELRTIRPESIAILNEQYRKTLNLLLLHQEKLDVVALELLAEESIDRDRFLEIVDGIEIEPPKPCFV